MNSFLLSALSAIALLSIAVIVAIISKRYRFPYTVALVGCGMAIAFLADYPLFAFIDDFKLTPEMLLYVFLPILLFEAAYNIGYKDFFRNIKSISALAVISLLISAIAIAFGLHYGLLLIGIEVPLIVTFLFGSLISATDPVAVLALFKELGAPKRLTLIFEGESLFNDGTALALFLVALSVIIAMSGGSEGHGNIFMSLVHSMTHSLTLSGFLSFVSMIVTGIVFGLVIGFAFSRAIGTLKNEEFLELVLTLSLAHATFIGAEILNHFVLPVSGVIATTIAAMVLGNYGRYKISPPVEKTMGHYWEFFAFLANSLVFMLVGIMIIGMDLSWFTLLLPVGIAVIVVLIARALSVYSVIGVLNWRKWEEYIPAEWQHLLSWGSLRGALAIIMVLLIPQDLTLPGWNLDMSIRDFVLALTVGCIVFTTFVKATTIFPIMKKFKLLDFADDETIEILKGELRMLLDVGQKIESIAAAGRLPKDEIELLQTNHRKEFTILEKKLEAFLKKDPKTRDGIIRQTVAKHALGLERYWLKDMFAHSEVSERTFKKLLRKIENQSYRLSEGKTQIRGKAEVKESSMIDLLADIILRIWDKDTNPEYIQTYLKARTRTVIASRVLRDLEDLEKIEFLRNHPALEETRNIYKKFEVQAEMVRREIFEAHRKELLPLDSRLAEKSLSLTKLKALDALVEKGSLSPKIGNILKEDAEHTLYASLKI